MSKHLKLTIKNSQLAQAINLSGVKDKLAKNKEDTSEQKKDSKKSPAKEQEESEESSVKNIKEEAPRRARSKSVFAEGSQQKGTASTSEEVVETQISEDQISTPYAYEEEKETEVVEVKPLSEPKEEVFKEDTSKIEKETLKESSESLEKKIVLETPKVEISTPKKTESAPKKAESTVPPKVESRREFSLFKREQVPPAARVHQPYEKLGPTGKHIKDLAPVRKASPSHPPKPVEVKSRAEHPPQQRPTTEPRSKVETRSTESSTESKKASLKSPREFRDVKNEKKPDVVRTFDARDRQGLRDNSEDEQRWRKRRYGKGMRSIKEEIPVVRPTSLKVRLPISIKDLAAEMKLKASQLIAKLFMQGVVVTLNDLLEDQTTVQLLGHEFGCEIEINTAEEERIRITDKKVKEEIAASPEENLIIRPPVVAFMGHVDHGKTSLIDRIRLSNRAAGEAGAITQHIGAFCCKTAVGNITILDTPGHEAFSAMRARGADVTDIVVLVVAGDEGIRQQTVEAIQHALTANVNIVVAINKADKPGFNAENVYRQLAENNLLPEVWGGQILTVNCSAVTGAGVKELLEALALQAEILELKADPHTRARGTVIESEMHKGMGYVATVLVQNGTLQIGDSLVFEQHWGRVKTMRNEFGKDISKAGPSTPVSITGLSGLPDAGQEFIVVKNEREAREISEKRVQGLRQISMQQRRPMTAEGLLQQAPTTKKVLNLILRADVQGSLEALKIALKKIQSTKAELNIIYSGVGEILESDIELAAGSKATVLGFHTQVEGHAENLIRQLGVQVRLHKIIYHAIDDVKEVMTGLLDKIAQETNRGKVEVKTLFRSSQAGTIAGCMVLEGPVQRNHHVRIIRNGAQIGKAQIQSLRRNKDDVREVQKGMECGIVLSKGSDVREGDILEAYEITYITQEL